MKKLNQTNLKSRVPLLLIMLTFMILRVNSALATEGVCWIHFEPCPSNMNIESCDPSTGTYTAIALHDGGRTDLDASDPVTYKYSFSGATTGSGTGTGSGSTFQPGTTTVVVSAKGTAGNCEWVVCTFTITVQCPPCDPPSFVGTLSDVSGSPDAGICGKILAFSPSVSGSSGTFSYTLTGATIGSGSGIPSGFTFNLGITLITLSYTNACGTATASFNATVGCGAGEPTGANVYTGNVSLTTQTAMDAFFATSGANSGNKYTKIVGNLTVDGNHSSDPITSLCNLNALTEVTGTVLITKFNRTGNPPTLCQLARLKTVGCNFTVTTSTKLLIIELPSIETLGCSLYVLDNVNAISIYFPKLRTVKGDRINVKGNLRAESIILSDQAGSYRFIGKGSVVDVSNNGGSTSNPLTIRMRKITYVNGSFTFDNNNNVGVVNFDSIFGGLDTVRYGMIVTNNSYLNKCCIVATTMVTGGRTISGNTGNCATSAAVLADCGAFSKRIITPSGNIIDNNGISVNVYPSPNKGKFGIDIYTTEATTANITITDLLGRQVYSLTKEVNGVTNIPVILDYAPDGQYIVKAEINGQIIVKRVLLAK